MRVLVAAAICLVAVCGQQEESKAPEAPSVVVSAPLSQEEVDSHRVTDLVALNSAIERYHAARASYPVSPGGGFSQEIPGLAPEFISEIPREPTGSTDPNGPQYRYASNGEDYKIIAHGVSAQCGPHIERDGVRVDPIRTRQDGQCWAYGFWSDGFRAF